MTTPMFRRKSISWLLIAATLISGIYGFVLLHTNSSGTAYASAAPFKDFPSLVAYIQKHHKAPFGRDISLNGQGTDAKTNFLKGSKKFAVQSTSSTNVKVNQDRNPWPKAELGAAVDPTSGNNYVVMANDFRENYDHQFYHVSTDGGKTWTDDSMTQGNDPITGDVPFSFQSDPGVAYDSVGHSFLSTISGNLIFDFTNGYINSDSQIQVVTGYAHGTYTDLAPINVDTQPCNGTFTAFTCPAQLDKPLITVDNVKGSPHNGRIYVYYTLFCNDQPCTDGSGTIPAFTSGIFESHADAAGLPFSAPELVSGSLNNTQFSDLVVDSHGVAHIFFDDFTNLPVSMYESTLGASGWTVNTTPVATFNFNGNNNPNWGFRDNGAVAPGCDIHKDTAYCAFSAQQIVGGKAASTPSVYLAKVNTTTGSSKITRVNNDPINNTKHHFFAWATVTPAGNVYVGWYDDRNDPFNTKVQYFVGKSTDKGATFPTQKAVSTASFNPCVGFPGCGFFGDYVQLVSGPDNVVHAAWSDTRDGASMQIYTQRVTW